MRQLIYKNMAKAFMALALIFVISACEDSFENGGFEVDSPSNVTAFKINGVSGAIDQKTGKINVTLPYGSEITAVIPEVSLQEGATTNLDLSKPINFTNPVKFRVVNGNLYKDYTVTVVVLSPIKSFKINSVEAIINDANKTITMTLPENTDLTALQPIIELTEGVSISPASGTTIDFTNPVIFVVTSNGKSVNYTANVGVPVAGLVVAFLGTAETRAGITNLDEITAADWLFQNFPEAKYISFDNILNGADLSDVDVIWWHYDSATNLPAVAYNPAVTDALKNYRTNGGNLLLTTFASQYVDALGIVPSGKGPNNVFGDFPPNGFVDGNSWGMSFVGHENHPIFEGLTTYETGKANLLQSGTFRLNHTAWWFVPEWGGYVNGEGWRNQTGGTNLASEAWDNSLDGRVTIAEWPNNATDKNVIVISMGAYDWYNETNSSGVPSQPNEFLSNIKLLTQNSINYLIEN
ncbi:putative glycoside hydrolase [compost metagenome]